MRTKKLIYVVDDNQFNLLMVSTRIKRVTNSKVKKFESADSCLQAIEREKPDLVVSDYYLQHGEHHMNGNHLLHLIKESNPDIPVIIYSQAESLDIASELIHEGATDFILGHKHYLNRMAAAVKHEISKMNDSYELVRGRRLILATIALLSSLLLVIYYFNEGYFKYFIILFITSLVLLLFFNKQMNALLHRF